MNYTIEQSDEQYIQTLLKESTKNIPLNIFMLTQIQYKPSKDQNIALDFVYNSVKDLLVKQRESKKVKDGFLSIFLNFYRLHKMSLSYSKESLDNTMMIYKDNNFYIGKNTCIPKIVNILVKDNYIDLVKRGHSYKKIGYVSTFRPSKKMFMLIDKFIQMKGKEDLNVIYKKYAENMVLRIKNDEGKKEVRKITWTDKLRKISKELDKINELLATADIGISDLGELQEIYDKKNYIIFTKQFDKETGYWLKQIKLYKKKNNTTDLNEKQIIDVIIRDRILHNRIKYYNKQNPSLTNEEIINRVKIDQKYYEPFATRWLLINPYSETKLDKIKRISMMNNLYMSLPDKTQKQLYRSYSGSMLGCGRHYGVFVQNLPREAQHLITINGGKTCQLDIKSMHPILIQDMEKQFQLADKDFYDIGVKQLTMRTLKKGELITITDPKQIRDKVKIILLILLNSKTEKQYLRAGRFIQHTTENLLLLKKNFIKIYPFLLNYILKDDRAVGNHLMNLESNYMHQVLIQLTKKNIIVVPFMDGICCLVKDIDKVKSVMFNQWKKLYSIDIDIVRKV